MNVVDVCNDFLPTNTCCTFRSGLGQRYYLLSVATSFGHGVIQTNDTENDARANNHHYYDLSKRNLVLRLEYLPTATSLAKVLSRSSSQPSGGLIPRV